MGKRIFIVQIILAALIFGCTKSQATVVYQAGDTEVAKGQTLQYTFDADRVGDVPAGAEVFSGTWQVKREMDAPSSPNVLCQTGSAGYPALSLDKRIFGDMVATVRFKPVSGSGDRAAGIIFRIQDSDNYYILRANALEDNVNIYKYVGGSRHEIQGGSAKVPSGKWQELRVEVTGNSMRGFLDGKLVVEAVDDTFKAGKVGLWTKSDSVSCFDDVKITGQ